MNNKDHYLNPSNSKCPKCTDIAGTGYIDLDSSISVIEENVMLNFQYI